MALAIGIGALFAVILLAGFVSARAKRQANVQPVEGMPDPGWYQDPVGRHERRWWNGQRWTDQVASADGGDTGVDRWTYPSTPPTPSS